MKKTLFILLALTLSAALWAQQTINNVTYIDAKGDSQTANNVTVITGFVIGETVTWGAAGQTTWYVVQNQDFVSLSKGVICYGDVHLILADGAFLDVQNVDNSAGIQVSGEGNSLTIYGQAAQSGELAADGGENAAGIGGGSHGSGSNITINGGKVTAIGGPNAAGIGGGNEGFGSNITINGGTITATGGNEAAGIGGGYYGSGTNITINGGKVTANGGNNGPGIGGGSLGSECSNITINNGEVTANGGQLRGAGIGGGALCHHCFNINITGGKVTATAAATGGGAGIGLDADGSMSFDSCHDIYITGGEVTASGAAGVSAIGCRPGSAEVRNIFAAAPLTIRADNNNPPTTIIAAARNSDTDITNDLGGRRYAKIEIGQTKTITYGDYISVSPQFESGAAIKEGIVITFTAADRWTNNYEFIGLYKEDTFDTPITEGVSGRVYTVTVMDDDISVYAKYEAFTPIPYIDADGQEKIARATGITNETTTLNAGWYVVAGTNVQTGTLTCNGAVHLILADGGKLTATGGDNQAGITVSGEGNSLTIYGQDAQSGQLIAKGGYMGAGIGGGNGGSGTNITINGGVVTANGGEFGAAIGGGYYGSGTNITINGGTVTANGGGWASGIGGGNYGHGSSDITINGGVVKANAGIESVAGIGGGNGGSCSNIFVAAELTVRANYATNPPVTVIVPDHTIETDITADLNGKRYVIVGTPQGGTVTYGDYITVSPEFESGDHITGCTQVTFTAVDRFADNYDFVGFYKESTFITPITAGVSGRVYTVTMVDEDISVYAKYEEFIPTPYIDANGQEQSVKTTEITNETSTLNAGWYVVTGEVSRGNITCNGAVHLILADGAKLTATGGENQAGIAVSGNGKSLTIYGQTAQSGQLIAQGGKYAAGIGGGKNGAGSDITINGGNVTATGGEGGAGIGGGQYGSGSGIIINNGMVTANGGDWASGIGGGFERSGSDITINGGTVTANAGRESAAIGGGQHAFGSNIKVAAELAVYADNTTPPTNEILHTDNDIAPYIAALRYVVVKDEMTNVKNEAIAAINAAIIGVTNADIIAIATYAIDAINAAANPHEIEIIKAQALAAIASAKAIYNSALGEMGVPCDDCPAVDVTKGTTTIRLYSPEKVEFRKME